VQSCDVFISPVPRNLHPLKEHQYYLSSSSEIHNKTHQADRFSQGLGILLYFISPQCLYFPQRHNWHRYQDCKQNTEWCGFPVERHHYQNKAEHLLLLWSVYVEWPLFTAHGFGWSCSSGSWNSVGYLRRLRWSSTCHTENSPRVTNDFIRWDLDKTVAYPFYSFWEQLLHEYNLYFIRTSWCFPPVSAG